MKLLELTINNFRQFYGQTPTISFAHSDTENITIFHGNNGAGKTTLLNALTWLFYERFTDAFASPENLINKRAINEVRVNQPVELWVELFFEHYGYKYRLKRSKEYIRIEENPGWTESGPSNLEMDFVGEDGQWKPITDGISDTIGRILPEQLHRYFFLDGERIEVLQRPDKKDEITTAARILIGEEIIIRSIRHLEQAQKKLEKEYMQIGDSETQELLEQKDKLETERDFLIEGIKQKEKNIEGYKKHKKAIEDTLRKLPDVEKLQKRRDDLNAEHENITKLKAKSLANIGNLISTNGYRAFLKPAIDSFKAIIEDLHKKGELPSAIKSPFVKELLNRGKCICDRPLNPGEQPYIKVEEWLERSGMSLIEEEAIKMDGEIGKIELEVPTLFENLDSEQAHMSKYKEQLSKIEEELDEIGEELKQSPQEKARDLQNKLDQLEKAIRDEDREKLRQSLDLDYKIETIEKIEKEIRERQGKDEKQKLAKRRLEACMDATNLLKDYQIKLREQFKKDLNSRIKKIFSSISYKPYVPILGEDYSLTLVESQWSDLPVAASTGENQILSLSFIGAVIEQARYFTAKRDRMAGPDSSEFPIILDSPFGSLDSIYRRQIATSIPQLANQVIVFVSKTQFKGEVEKAMHSKIGKEYVLLYNSPKDDVEEDFIERYEQTYELVKKTSEAIESTEIVEVIKNG